MLYNVQMDHIIKSSYKSDAWPRTEKTKALVFMSGGVDSTAAALILIEKGYSVAGLTMHIEGSSAVKDAASVCTQLSIPHFYIDVAKDFRDEVISPFWTSYRKGRTPNPCADCNERIKFGLLRRIAEKMWGDDLYIATGHYARIVKDGENYYLAMGLNKAKDQSYFLAGIPRRILPRTIFPLGEFRSKEDTRAFMRAKGMESSEKPESMEICFLTKAGYRPFTEKNPHPGPITDMSGKVLGEHSGIAGFTLGQRKGIGIAHDHPLFVVSIVPETNTIVVAERAEAFRSEVTAVSINIIAPEFLSKDLTLWGKIRSQGAPQPCRLLDASADRISVTFSEPVFAPAPGQRIVLYTDRDLVTAGGIVERSA